MASRSGGIGIGIGTVLFIVFLVLKLCGIITWSWWWVTSPIWIPIVIVFGIVGIAFIIALLNS